jgi:hypothetical protein
MNKIFKAFFGYLLVLLLIGCFGNGQVGLSPRLSGKYSTGGVVMTQNISPILSAEVLLKSRSGRSMASPDVAITAENVEEFTPTPETIAEATKRLQELGFTVSQVGVTLTIEGELARFEKVFGVKLNVERDEAPGNVIVQPESELVIPESLKGVIEQVVFPKPPEFFP